MVSELGKRQLSSRVAPRGGSRPVWASMWRRLRSRSPGVLWLVLLVGVGGHQLWYSVNLVRTAASLTSRARLPLRHDRMRAVWSAEEEALQAGIQLGDLVEQVGGQPFTGARILDDAIRDARSNETLAIAVRRPDGVLHEVRIRLRPRSSQPYDLAAWLVLAVLNILLPLSCLALGYIAVLLRMRRPLAWLLLALMISFSQLIVEPVSSGVFRTAEVCLGGVAEKTLGIWILLFAIYFPERSIWDRRSPRLKWLFVAPLAIVGAVRVFEEAAVQESFARVAMLAPYSPLLRQMVLALTIGCLAGALVLLVIKKYAARPDEIRRMRILLAGSVVSFGPLLMLVIVSAVRGGSGLQKLPQWASLWAVLLLGIFPATMIYLVLAPQVLELRLVIREGLLYGLLARGVTTVRRVLIAFVALALVALSARSGPVPTADIAILAQAMVFIVLLQPEAAMLLRGWLDRVFFRDAHQRQAALAAVAENAWNERQLNQLTDLTARGLMQFLGVSRVAILVRAGTTYTCTVDLGPATPAEIPALELALPDRLLRQDRAVLVYGEQARSWVRLLKPEERELLDLLDTRVLVPVKRGGQVLGLISLGRKVPDQAFSASELRALKEVAGHFGVGLECCQLLDSLRTEIIQGERLKAEREAADQANQAKSRFLANMSHELRTPLNAILGYSEMLRETAEELNDKAMMADLDRIHAAGSHLLALINSVLELSKIEAGKMGVCLETVAVFDLVLDVSAIAKPAVEKNGNRFVCDLEDGIDTIVADAMKLRQVLMNLLSNAGKFTVNGTVTLAVRRDSADAGAICFQVRDTGIGMTPEQMSGLFQPFVQASAAISRKYGGTGLGLALSRRFCHLMGGDITLVSTPGVGSVFTVRLPVNRPNPLGATEESSVPPACSATTEGKEVGESACISC